MNLIVIALLIAMIVGGSLAFAVSVSRYYDANQDTIVDLPELFRSRDALWQYDHDPSKPHAELTAGDCSDGYIDVLRVLSDSRTCMDLAALLVGKLRETYIGPVHWVVGSDHAGATLSFCVAYLLGARHDFTEKFDDGHEKRQDWRRMRIGHNEIVLQVEEMVTTTTTLERVRAGLRVAHPEYPIMFAPVTLTLVNRSPFTEYEGAPLIAGLNVTFNQWKPAECPLCKTGSLPLKPKKNWEKFSQK